MHSDGPQHPTKVAGPRRSLPRDSANTPRPATTLGFATLTGPCWLRRPRYRVFAQPLRETKSRGRDGTFLGGQARKRNHRVRMLGEDRSVDSEAHVADGTGGSHWRTVSSGVSWRAVCCRCPHHSGDDAGLAAGGGAQTAQSRPANPATSVGAGWLELPCCCDDTYFRQLLAVAPCLLHGIVLLRILSRPPTHRCARRSHAMRWPQNAPPGCQPE